MFEIFKLEKDWSYTCKNSFYSHALTTLEGKKKELLAARPPAKPATY
jgi:hypothetical protein